MSQLPSVSIVIPLYNEASVLDELARRLAAVIAAQPTYHWEVILIDDGSSDGSESTLTELTKAHPWLRVIFLSRNFGHQIAITAGIDQAQGDAVIVMDGDLQDPPELIAEMLTLWQQGFEVVYATRKDRAGENFFKKFTASAYYRILSSLTDTAIPLDTGDFRLMARPVVNALQSMREKNRFIRGLVSWTGYRQTPIYYDRDPRHQGESKYPLFKMTRFALDGLISFSKVPLQWITNLGFFMSLSSFIGILIVVYLKLINYPFLVQGWSSIMIGMFMLGGIQLICLGMIGEYVGRIFDEVRNRPLYLIRKTSD